VLELAARPRPCYVRLPKGPVASGLDGFDPAPVVGAARALRRGTDLTLMSTGDMWPCALEVADQLALEGTEAAVLHLPTLKPIDVAAIVSAPQPIVTLENHSVIGGLGSAVAEVLSRARPGLVEPVGIDDRFGESGSGDDLRAALGLDVRSAVRAAHRVLHRSAHQDYSLPVGSAREARNDT
jgi:transketolase